jgi:hypothetical protein
VGFRLPSGGELALPKLGDVVLVAFPTRGWNCPAIVVGVADPKEPGAKLELMVFNKNTAFQHTHLRKGVPHSAFGSGDGPVWSWRP